MIVLTELEAARLFFDETYYLSANPDVREAIAGGAFSQGWQHFGAFGAAEGRNPSAGFDTAYYLSENQDVAAALASEAISSAFGHYIVFGREEGRAPVDPLTGLIEGITLSSRLEVDLLASNGAAELFDESYYLANNTDVAAALAGGAFKSGREHFILYGAAEGRNPSESFDTIYYLEQNSDVAAALVSGAIASAFGHYLRSGRSEGRLSNRPPSNILVNRDRSVRDVTGQEAIIPDTQVNLINSQTQQVEEEAIVSNRQANSINSQTQQTTVATVNWPQLVSAALVSPLNPTDSSDSNDSGSNNNAASDSISETDNTGSSASSSNNSSTDNSSSSNSSSTDNSSTDNSSSSNNSSTDNSTDNSSSSNSSSSNSSASNSSGSNSSDNSSSSNSSGSNNSVTNPGILAFSSGNFSVNEGDGTATIAISRTGGSDGEVSVDYITGSSGTAMAGTDYATASGTLTFADGANNASFAIAVLDDTNFEGDETVNLVLSNATGGATLGTVTSSTLTIVDNDAANPGSLQFNSANFSVNEGEGTATIAISRTGGSDGEVTVDYITGSSGTATAGTDYTTASGTLTFADGETSKSFSIPIADDGDAESNETVEITLSNAVGGSLGSQNMTTLTILDDDPIGGLPAAIDSTFVGFSALTSEAAIAATKAQRLTIGTQTIYIGTDQKSTNNQNPIIASFDSANPANNWVRNDYETAGADGRGFGLFWDGTNLYGVFSIDGTQGTSSQDFRRATTGATQNWLKSYGSGGGAKVSVLARINPATGEMTEAAYLSALLSSGKSNTLTVTDISTNANGNLVVQAQSFFSPRNPDGTRMTQVGSGSSPFDYTVEITPDLKTVVSTSAVGWQ
ncbi:MAG: hypothetical protein F6J93_00765 [Oscillatoria sp. SIO1A7]|nr:hypothetical protein [Oscillatoria sp. SIO1A7]